MKRGKMMRRLKSIGRCRVQGHGQGCELNAEINSRPATRAQEKRGWMQDVRADVVATGARVGGTRPVE